jgi:PhnB protein
MLDDTSTAAKSRPDPAVMRGVIPSLSLDGRASEAAEFYARAFGAREMGRHSDENNPGRLLHLQIEINGGALMMTDCRAPWESGAAKPQGFTLQLVVADGDAWWSRALAAGCTVVMPFERQFWGDRWGMVRDPFGIEWGIDEPVA